jgi:hypothetical protein
VEPGERFPTEHVPVEVEHRLACARPDIDDHAVVLEALGCSHLGHEPQHPTGFLVRKSVDLAEGVDVPLGQHEQVRLCGGRDITDCDETACTVHVIAAVDEATEEAVIP